MYPSRDFRSLIQTPDVDTETLLKSIHREPFSELMRFWSQVGKTPNLYPLLYQGIIEAISLDRYPMYQLEEVDIFPEWNSAIVQGLEILWTTLRVSLDQSENGNYKLCFDKSEGIDIDISPQDKSQFLYLLSYKNTTPLLINGILRTVQICVSPRAEQLYKRANKSKTALKYI